MKHSMNEVFPVLLELQVILAKKIEVQREIENLPKALEEMNESYNFTKDSHDELKELMDKVSNDVTSLRIKLDDAQREHEKFQMQASEIHSSREFEILNKDIEDAKLRETELRNALKSSERELRLLDNSLSEKLELLNEQSKTLKVAKAELSEKLSVKEKELKSLLKEEEKHTPKLDATQLFKFERIIENKGGVGIVPVHGVVCLGCHMTLPRQFVNDVREAKSIHYCPYCSRILFYEEFDSEDGETFDASEGSIDLTDGDEDFLL